MDVILINWRIFQKYLHSKVLMFQLLRCVKELIMHAINFMFITPSCLLQLMGKILDIHILRIISLKLNIYGDCLHLMSVHKVSNILNRDMQ